MANIILRVFFLPERLSAFSMSLLHSLALPNHLSFFPQGSHLAKGRLSTSPLSRFPWWASQSLCLPNHLWAVTSQIRIARPRLSLKWLTHIVCASFYWEGLPSTSNSIQAKLSPSHQTSSSCFLLYFALAPWSLPAPFLSLVHIWAVFKTFSCCLNHNSLCIVIAFRSHCHHPGSVPDY